MKKQYESTHIYTYICMYVNNKVYIYTYIYRYISTYIYISKNIENIKNI